MSIKWLMHLSRSLVIYKHIITIVVMFWYSSQFESSPFWRYFIIKMKIESFWLRSIFIPKIDNLNFITCSISLFINVIMIVMSVKMSQFEFVLIINVIIGTSVTINEKRQVFSSHYYSIIVFWKSTTMEFSKCQINLN